MPATRRTKFSRLRNPDLVHPRATRIVDETPVELLLGSNLEHCVLHPGCQDLSGHTTLHNTTLSI